MNEDFQILFSKYSNNELSVEERQAFDLRLTKDQEFKAEFDIFNSMNSFIDKNNEHKNALSVFRNFHEKEQIQKDPIKVRSINPIYILVFLLLLIAAFLAYKYLLKPESNSTKIYAEAYVEPNWPIARGSTSTLEEAVYNFRNGNKKIALDSFYNSKAIKASDKNYWLAELYLWDNQADSTLVLIEKIDNNTLRDRIIYLEIMSYLQNNDTASLKKRLTSLPNDLSTYYQNIINALAERIN